VKYRAIRRAQSRSGLCLALVRGDGLAVGGEAGMKIVVGIGGQDVEGAVGEGNNANLLTQKSSFRRGGGTSRPVISGSQVGSK